MEMFFSILLREKPFPHCGEDLLHERKKQPLNEIIFAPMVRKTEK
jgi:hypothetical protein